jgi:hypothetical protein
MAWRAGTHHGSFNAGTMIAVFQEPWLDEEELGVPPVGETIALMFPSRTFDQVNRDRRLGRRNGRSAAGQH